MDSPSNCLRGLTLKKVIEISVAMETAAKDAVVLRNSYSDGQGHYANECRFKEAIYHKCNKKGHIKKACKGKKISDTRKLHLLGDNEDDESDSYGIYSVSKKAKDAIVIKPCVEQVNIPMELDTGSAVSVISHVDYRKYFPTLALDSTSVTFNSITLFPGKFSKILFPSNSIENDVTTHDQTAAVLLFEQYVDPNLHFDYFIEL
jgi:hypothetical protein